MKHVSFKILALVIITTCSSCKVGRFAYYNYANITDYKIFPNRTIEKPEQPFIFQKTKKPLIQD
ncbi:MAG TPA: serine hydrolase, partial [Flavobacteriaceae bacterium]|nr:serine hydrolase [Flavobacteriaceae bacterium]